MKKKITVLAIALLGLGFLAGRAESLIRWRIDRAGIEVGLEGQKNLHVWDGEMSVPVCFDSNSPKRLFGICGNSSGKICVRDGSGVFNVRGGGSCE